VIRAIDALLALLGLLFLLPLIFLLLILGWLDTRSPLFFQDRVGKDQRNFKLVKFRTMRPSTLSVATHLVDPASVTRLGGFLRRSKLDELPQLWNVLRGDMSLVGPRPCLPSQKELVESRSTRSVFDVRPGITGLAQVRGVDMSTPELLAQIDQEMISNYGLRSYVRLLMLTLLGQGRGDRIVEK